MRENYILLIDDDPVSNFMVERLIKKLNSANRVKICRNGKEGLRFIDENMDNLPKVIILDLNMPVMDGLEFLSFYKELGISKEVTKVILSTTTINDEDLQSLPADCEVILKPLTAEKLNKILEVEASCPK